MFAIFINKITSADNDDAFLLNILRLNIGLMDLFSYIIKIKSPITPNKSVNLPK